MTSRNEPVRRLQPSIAAVHRRGWLVLTSVALLASGCAGVDGREAVSSTSTIRDSVQTSAPATQAEKEGADDPVDREESADRTGTRPVRYGDSDVLDQMWEDCEGESFVACNNLFDAAPAGSEYSDFAAACGVYDLEADFGGECGPVTINQQLEVGSDAWNEMVRGLSFCDALAQDGFPRIVFSRSARADCGAGDPGSLCEVIYDSTGRLRENDGRTTDSAIVEACPSPRRKPAAESGGGDCYAQAISDVVAGRFWLDLLPSFELGNDTFLLNESGSGGYDYYPGDFPNRGNTGSVPQVSASWSVDCDTLVVEIPSAGRTERYRVIAYDEDLDVLSMHRERGDADTSWVGCRNNGFPTGALATQLCGAGL